MHVFRFYSPARFVSDDTPNRPKMGLLAKLQMLFQNFWENLPFGFSTDLGQHTTARQSDPTHDWCILHDCNCWTIFCRFWTVINAMYMSAGSGSGLFCATCCHTDLGRGQTLFNTEAGAEQAESPPSRLAIPKTGRTLRGEKPDFTFSHTSMYFLNCKILGPGVLRAHPVSDRSAHNGRAVASELLLPPAAVSGGHATVVRQLQTVQRRRHRVLQGRNAAGNSLPGAVERAWHGMTMNRQAAFDWAWLGRFHLCNFLSDEWLYTGPLLSLCFSAEHSVRCNRLKTRM